MLPFPEQKRRKNVRKLLIEMAMKKDPETLLFTVCLKEDLLTTFTRKLSFHQPLMLGSKCKIPRPYLRNLGVEMAVDFERPKESIDDDRQPRPQAQGLKHERNTQE